MKTANDAVIIDAMAGSSIDNAIRDFGRCSGPARVLFDNDSQKAFLRTYSSVELRGICKHSEPFIVLCEKGMPVAAS